MLCVLLCFRSGSIMAESWYGRIRRGVVKHPVIAGVVSLLTTVGVVLLAYLCSHGKKTVIMLLCIISHSYKLRMLRMLRWLNEEAGRTLFSVAVAVFMILLE